MSPREKRLLERQDGGKGKEKKKDMKEERKKEEWREVKETNWCFIFSYDFRRDSRRDVPDNF